MSTLDELVSAFKASSGANPIGQRSHHLAMRARQELGPEQQKELVLRLIPTDWFIGNILPSALASSGWTASELEALLSYLYSLPQWPWEISAFWYGSAPPPVSSLWMRIEEVKGHDRYPHVLLRFLDCIIHRSFDVDPRIARKAMLAYAAVPAVLQHTVYTAADTPQMRDKASSRQLLAVYEACGRRPESTARVIAALLGLPDNKPAPAWYREWSEATAHLDGPSVRELCRQLWTVAAEPETIVDRLAQPIVRGALLGVAPHATAETCDELKRVALHWFRAAADFMALEYSLGFVLTAVRALGQCGEAGIPHLQELAHKIKHKTVRKTIDEALAHQAGRQDLDPETLLDLNVDACGLDEAGGRSWTVDAYTITLGLDPRGRVQVEYQSAGRPVKSLPPAVKSEHADLLADVKRAQKKLQETYTTQKARLEQALISERTWQMAHWQKSLGTNPILWHLARRLIWQVTLENAVVQARPDAPDRWLDAEDRPVAVPAEARLSLLHPVHLTRQELELWQRHIVRHRVVQPTKQAFRETYVLTPAEEQTETYSNRFARHVVPHPTLYALIRERNWSGLGYVGEVEPARRDYPNQGIRAYLERHFGTEDWGMITLDRVRFVRLERKGKRLMDGPELPLREVPAVVFSEAMRDVDLLAGVASIGTEEEITAATADRRADMFREVLPALGLGDRVRNEDRYVLVQGKLHLYRIHLGSGNIHMEPSGRYLCIVPSAPKKQEMYVPFEEGDLKTAEILSKILLLAEDHKIKDSSITRQL